jgi:hypothetical protein
MCVCVCVCVCVSERERERESACVRERERERVHVAAPLIPCGAILVTELWTRGDKTVPLYIHWHEET